MASERWWGVFLYHWLFCFGEGVRTMECGSPGAEKAGES